MIVKYLLFATDGDSIWANSLPRAPEPMEGAELVLSGRSAGDCLKAIEQLVHSAQSENKDKPK